MVSLPQKGDDADVRLHHQVSHWSVSPNQKSDSVTDLGNPANESNNQHLCIDFCWTLFKCQANVTEMPTCTIISTRHMTYVQINRPIIPELLQVKAGHQNQRKSNYYGSTFGWHNMYTITLFTQLSFQSIEGLKCTIHHTCDLWATQPSKISCAPELYLHLSINYLHLPKIHK